MLWALLILALTSVPGADLPQASLFPEADKVVHFGLYAILGLLSVRAAFGEGSRDAALVRLVAIAIGIFAALDEVHQRFIPGRSMDVRDWMADVAGALVGMWIFDKVQKRREQET